MRRNIALAARVVVAAFPATPAAALAAESHGAGTAWAVETVTKAGYLSDAALVLDAAGRTHLAYYDGDAREVRYARRDDAGWEMTRVATLPRDYYALAGYPIALVLDNYGHPHIAFVAPGKWDEKTIRRRPPEPLKYARWNGRAFDVVTVNDDAGDVVRLVLALDAAGFPHAAFWRAGEDRRKAKLPAVLYHACYDGRRWKEETVVRVGPDSYETDSAVASSYPRFAFAGAEETRVLVGKNDAPPPGYAVPARNWYAHAATDARGRLSSVRSGYTGRDRTGVNCTFWPGDEAREDVADDRWWIAPGAALALDPSGRPVVAYFDRFELRCARWDGAAWRCETVAPSLSQCGFHRYVTAAVDGAGRPHIFFWDLSTDEWKYAVGRDVFPPGAIAEEPARDVSGEARPAPWYPDISLLDPTAPAYSRQFDGVVVDGRSTWVVTESRVAEFNGYETAIKIKKADGETEWQTPSVFYEGGSMALVLFAQPFDALREGPDAAAPAIRPETDFWDRDWALRPRVPAGQLYEVLARCGDWLCVGRGWGEGAWLPLATPGLAFFFKSFSWTPPMAEAYADFYLPVAGDFTRVLFSIDEYMGQGQVLRENAVVTVYTDGASYDARPTGVGFYGGSESGISFYEADFPTAVPRGQVRAVGVTCGPPGERMHFAVDLAKVWARPADAPAAGGEKK